MNVNGVEHRLEALELGQTELIKSFNEERARNEEFRSFVREALGRLQSTTEDALHSHTS